MSSNSTDGRATEKRTVIENRELGSRQVGFEQVRGASTAVEIPPEAYEDDTISVKAFAFDDEPGQVELYLGQEVQIAVTLEADGARRLAERLAAAAREADRDVETEAQY